MDSILQHPVLVEALTGQGPFTSAQGEWVEALVHPDNYPALNIPEVAEEEWLRHVVAQFKDFSGSLTDLADLVAGILNVHHQWLTGNRTEDAFGFRYINDEDGDVISYEISVYLGEPWQAALATTHDINLLNIRVPGWGALRTAVAIMDRLDADYRALVEKKARLLAPAVMATAVEAAPAALAAESAPALPTVVKPSPAGDFTIQSLPTSERDQYEQWTADVASGATSLGFFTWLEGRRFAA